MIVAILHAVQDGIQKHIANKIEHLSMECDSTVASVEFPADDTALYRLSGWALKCCIENCEKDYEKKKMPHTQEQLQLLLALTRGSTGFVSARNDGILILALLVLKMQVKRC